MIIENPEFFRISQLPPYALGEMASAVQKARQAGRDIIDLSQVNPNLGPPALAVDKLVQASLQAHNHRYSSSQGITRLREAFARWYNVRYNVELCAEAEVVVTMGAKEGLSHLLLSVVSPGDTILVPTPSYPIHTSAVFIAGASFVGVPLLVEEDEEDSRKLTGESSAFFARLTSAYEQTWPRPKVFVCSFPHNPTTIVATPDFFERLVAFCKERNLLIVHDFAYGDICFDSYRAPSILQVPGAKEIAVEFYSMSKGFNLPGWRVAFCAGNKNMASALKKIKSYLDFGIFQPLQIASAAVLEQSVATGGALLDEIVGTYQSRRDTFVSALRGAGWNVSAPEATVFIWSKLPASALPEGSLSFCKTLLEQAGVALCPGVGFGSDGDSFVRFALVEGEKRLREAGQRIGKMS